MNNIVRESIYQIKNSFRDMGFLFWCLLYPIILAMFFNAAFGGMLNPEIENIDVGIANDNQISYILEEIEFLNVHKVSDDDIVEKLHNEKIDGFVDNELNLTVVKSGISQTIIKEVVEQIKETYKLNRPIDGSEFTTDYVLDINQNSSPLVISFYSLIAMVSIYGMFAGIEISSSMQANLSNIGIRLNASPIKKSTFLLSGVIVALLLNLFSNLMLIIFTEYILKIHLFDEVKFSTIFIILGNLFGVALGIFIGASNKKSLNAKTLMSIGIALLLSFLSGMMGPWIKIVIDKNIPILGRINPVSIITNNLYRINLLGSTKSVEEGIIILILYSIALVIASYIFLRRKSYDSI